MSETLVTDKICEAIPECPPGARAVFAGLPDGAALHDRCLHALPLFHQVEQAATPAPPNLPDQVRVGAWNLERCAEPEATSRILGRAGIDVAFLSEMDVGMARTRQAHTPRTVLAPLGHGYLYGVEFLELGLGSAREQRLCAGQINTRGFHGNVLSAAYPLRDPVLIRFDRLATWFAPDCDERRIGSRMALAARMDLASGPLVLVSAHLESRMTAAQRAVHMAGLLEAVETYAGGDPVIMGGDFNTDSDAWTLGKGVEGGTPAWARIHERTLDPVAHEPLFEVAGKAGYEWAPANMTGRTTRETPQSGPRRYPELRLDWFFVKGLKCRAPATVPAVDEEGRAVSDHDLIQVDIARA